MLTIRTSFDSTEKKYTEKEKHKILDSTFKEFMPKPVDRESDHNLKNNNDESK